MHKLILTISLFIICTISCMAQDTSVFGDGWPIVVYGDSKEYNDSILRYSPSYINIDSHDNYTPDIPQLLPKSPEAYAFQKLDECTANEFTGSANINIPLFTIKDHDLEIPISLTYAGNGIKVQEEASWVGLGWNLNIGGQISFVQAGKLDNYTDTYGWRDYYGPYIKNAGSFDNFRSNIDLSTNNVGSKVGARLELNDAERDFYSVNVMGHSFLFVINPYNNLPQQIGEINDTIKIIPGTYSDGHYQSWTIKTPDGIQYIFAPTEYNSSADQQPIVSVWGLQQVVSPLGFVAKFSYGEPVSINPLTSISQYYDFTKTKSSVVGAYMPTDIPNVLTTVRGLNGINIQKQYLTSITTDNYKVSFALSNERRDLPSVKRIDSVNFVSSLTGKQLKKFNFNYDYFTSSQIGGNYYKDLGLGDGGERTSLRLKLLSIDELGGTEKLTTSFSYDESIPLPQKTSYAIDFWGYYNGEANDYSGTASHVLVPSLANFVDDAKMTPAMKLFKGANRFTSSKHAKAFILTGITFPTKAKTCLTYESNQYLSNIYMPDNDKFKSSLEYKVYDTNSSIAEAKKQDHTFFELQGEAKGSLNISFSCNDGNHLRQLWVDNASVSFTKTAPPFDGGQSFKFRDLIENSPSLDKENYVSVTVPITLPKGSYVFSANLPNSVPEGKGCVFATMNLTQSLSSASIRKDSIASFGGGLRVSSIENYSSSGKLLDKTIYSYETDGGKSNGSLLIPIKVTDSQIVYNNTQSSCTKLEVLTSTSYIQNVPTFTQSLCKGIVGYSRIVTRLYDGDGNLGSYIAKGFSLTTAAPINCGLYTFSNLSCGLPTYSKTYTADGKLVRSQSYLYGYIYRNNLKANIAYRKNYRGITNTLNVTYNAPMVLDGYSFVTESRKLLSVQNTEYAPKGNVIQTTQYQYDKRNFLVSSVKESGSEKDTWRLTQYCYPADGLTAISQSMESAFLLSPVIEQREYLLHGSTQTATRRVRYDYQAYASPVGKAYLPYSIFYAMGSNSLEQRLSYTYDSYGNPTTITKDEQERNSWLWSYNHSLPIASVKGATTTELKGWLGNTYANLSANKSLQPSNMQEVQDKLMAKPALIMGMLYDHGIGVTKEYATNGNAMTYEYDTFGRLADVKNGKGEKMNKFTYHYPSADIPFCNVSSKEYLAENGQDFILTDIYDNGMGNPMEYVTSGISGNGKYTYSLKEYDWSGQTAKEFTYFPVDGDGGFMATNDILSYSRSFWSDRHPYILTNRDALGRTIKLMGYGSAWHIGDKSVHTSYDTNAENNVRLYGVSGNNLTNKGYYPKASLRMTETTDEDGKSLQVYTDLQDRKVLDRRDGSNDTYYVHDDLGQLRFVLSPAYQEENDLQKYAYEYRYDYRGRCIWKRLPGCEHQEMWYDKTDNLMFSQDGEQRKKGIYIFNLYDNLMRQVVQGTTTAINASCTSAIANYNAVNSGYFNSGYTPVENMGLQNTQLLVVNYFDTHDFLGNRLISQTTNHTLAPTTPTDEKYNKGILTGSVINTTNDKLLTSAFYHNAEGLVVQSKQVLLDETLLTQTTSYTFTKKPLAITTQVTRGGMSKTITQTNTYNRYNDMIESNTLNAGNGNKKIASYIYDDLGRLSSVARGGNAGTVSYSYNIRGWLKSITSPRFNQTLSYTSSAAYPCYNGNIARMQWKTGNDNIMRGYDFGYDGLNRLTASLYAEGSDMSQNKDRYSENILDYSANGSVERLQRYGKKNNGAFGLIDDLTYQYNGNQVKSISDKAGSLAYDGSFDFKDGANADTEYFYNANGALVKDLNKSIANIEYDVQGNLKCITFNNGFKTSYVYDASGNKLRTSHTSVVTNTTDYVGDFIFEDGKLSKYQFEGGYCSFDGNQNPTFHYYEKDHLGSIRMVLNENGTIEQVTHYYPFGGIYGDLSINAELQKNKYIGKEFDHMHGLDWHDHGARMYDAAKVTWDRPDPLSHKYYSLNPYLYCGDNPILFEDFEGKAWTDSEGNRIDNTENVRVYIFYSQDFIKQAKVQYEEAVKKYGKDAVAMSVTSSSKEFVNDWQNMHGNIISNVIIMTHGKNQSIALDDENQLTSTGTGKTNISGSKAMNVQDLPEPSGNISNAILNMYSCHSADKEPKKHGERPHNQGNLIGSKDPIAYAFARKFKFKGVIGTASSVNYYYWTNGVFPWSNKYLKPYPQNNKWIYIKRK